MERVGDLEIHQDLDYQEREWTLERVGWGVLALIVVLAGLGLFGHGPISWTSASTSDGALDVSFERFGRVGGTQDVVIRAEAGAAEADAWEIDISLEYLEAVQIDAVEPEPDSVESVPGGLRYTFTRAEPGAALDATFAVTPAALWSHGGDISLAGGDTVTVRHFFFP